MQGWLAAPGDADFLPSGLTSAILDHIYNSIQPASWERRFLVHAWLFKGDAVSTRHHILLSAPNHIRIFCHHQEELWAENGRSIRIKNGRSAWRKVSFEIKHLENNWARRLSYPGLFNERRRASFEVLKINDKLCSNGWRLRRLEIFACCHRNLFKTKWCFRKRWLRCFWSSRLS